MDQGKPLRNTDRSQWTDASSRSPAWQPGTVTGLKKDTADHLVHLFDMVGPGFCHISTLSFNEPAPWAWGHCTDLD